ncbi:BTB/POZ domain-containing protein 6-like [Contarinia nasturtii]|uniref:BTB/POZ domain-containing protein 6-like n=1 Tax=Contarinia nasturtii TaxID=265458 RepID=UPI0012D3E490|nr:BTB/POZ domain-containing protein 6-like [Contarinia nasturtii]
MDFLAKLALQRMTSLYEMRENNEAVDVHFIFDNDPSKRISAHKLILAAESPVFKAMFYGPMKEKDEINMADTTIESFVAFVKAIYQHFDAVNMENIYDVICLADRYDEQNVMDFCEKFFGLNANANNVCRILNEALRYRLTALESSCVSIMALHSKTILKSPSFLEMDFDTLEHIVKSQFVFCSAKDKLDACFKWAHHSCVTNAIDLTPENLRKQLDSALLHIRFDQMSAVEFIKYEELYPMFSFDEYKNIMAKINKVPVKCKKQQRRLT